MKEYKVKVYDDGEKRWFLNGKRHREDGPAIECANGSKRWFINDKLHREDGPAVEYHCNTKSWYLNGKRHREDGPAIERPDGDNEWYLNNDELSEEEFNIAIQPTVEMTMEEICNALNKNVKVIKQFNIF